jgi:2'-5' RNA ligase
MKTSVAASNCPPPGTGSKHLGIKEVGSCGRLVSLFKIDIFTSEGHGEPVSLRTFVALELKDEALRGRIGEMQEALQSTGAQLKAVEPQNLHITLKFIGEIPEPLVGNVIEPLKEVRVPPFSAHFRGLGVFPSPSRINVVWLGVIEGEERIRELSAQVNDKLAAFGRPEPFKAHLTIARVKGGRNVSELASEVGRRADEEGGIVSLTEFQLKKSVLMPSGPVYSDLAVFPLR